MKTHLFVFVIALAVSDLATAVIRRIAARAGLLDHPDDRKIHHESVPYMGGVAIFVAFFLAVAVGLHVNAEFRAAFLQRFVGLFVASCVIFLLGIFDDLGGSNASIKFLWQAVAGSIAFAYGFSVDRLTNPFGGTVVFDPVLAWGLTVLWFAAVTNAVNLIDGLDGLAAGVGAMAAVTLFLVGLERGEIEQTFLSIALAGALLGFLRHNFHPAKIFMGDTGALSLGFLLAAISTGSLTKATTFATLAVPFAAIGLPILDTTLAIIRRLSSGAPVFDADRSHLHHRLLALGLTHRQAVFLLYLVTLWFCALGYSFTFVGRENAAAIVAVIAVSAVAAAKVLTWIERARRRRTAAG